MPGMIQNFLAGIRRQDTWYQKAIYQTAVGLRHLRLPFPRFFGFFFFNGRNVWLTAWRRVKQFFFYEPMFRYRCARVGKAVYFESNFPLVLGYGTVKVGDKVRFSGNITLIVSYKANPNPTITIGNDVYLGFGTMFACADRITVGNRVLMAHGVQIYDNNTHPLDPEARARNLPVEKENVAPVVIEDDAWIGGNAVILRGVTIGRGSVVAIHSVVTRSVPPMSVAAGNPAVVVKQLRGESADEKSRAMQERGA
jgi:acetyltransferase-like isoleucine patch superfamily enzyme